MSPRPRRTFLRRGGTFVALGLAGCVTVRPGRQSSPTTVTTSPTTTESCSATRPPGPTTAEASPKSYPTRPSQFTTETVESYVRAYERTYQYNRQLAEYPDKLGATNELDVSILETTVESDDRRYAVTVSGQLNFSIVSRSGTPATPTQTPLPTGHRPFEASYVVTERSVSRDDIVVECW